MNFAVTGMTTAQQPPAGTTNATANATTGFAVAMDVALSASQPPAATTTTGSVQAMTSHFFTAAAGDAFSASPNIASVATSLPAIVSIAGLAGRLNASPTAGTYAPLAGVDALAIGPVVGTVATVTSPSSRTMPSDATTDLKAPAAAIIVNRPLPPITASDIAVIHPNAAGIADTPAPSLPAVTPSPTSARPATNSVAALPNSLLAVPAFDAAPTNLVIAAGMAMAASAPPVAIGPSPKTANAALVTSPELAAAAPGKSAADVAAMGASALVKVAVIGARTQAAGGDASHGADVATALPVPLPMATPGPTLQVQPLDAAAVAPGPQASNGTSQATSEHPMADRSAATASSSPLVATAGPLDATAIPQNALSGSPAMRTWSTLDHAADVTGQVSPVEESGSLTAHPTGEATPLERGPLPALAESPRAIEHENLPGAQRPATSAPLDLPPTIDAAIARSNAPSIVDGAVGLATSTLPVPNPGAPLASLPTTVVEEAPSAQTPPPVAGARPDLGGAPSHMPVAQATSPSVTEPRPLATDGTIPLAPAADDQPLATMAAMPRKTATDRTAPSQRASAGKIAGTPQDDQPVALPSVLSAQLLPGSSDASTKPGDDDRAPAKTATGTSAPADELGEADLAPPPAEPTAPPQSLSVAALALAAAQTMPPAGPTATAQQMSTESATAPVKDGTPRRASNHAPRRAKADPSVPAARATPSADAMIATPVKPLAVAASEAGSAVDVKGGQSPAAAGRLETSDNPTMGAGDGFHAVRATTPVVQNAAAGSDTLTVPTASHAPKPAANDGLTPPDGFNTSAGVAPAPPLDTSLRPIAAALHRPIDTPVVTAQPGQIGHEVGVEIARRISAGGEQLVVRLDPAELGRIEVHMSFDDRGSLRAIIAADSPVALDMLRRDSADLSRSLSDAGVRSDGQSLRFQNDGGGNGNQPRSPWLAADPKSPRQAPGSFGDEFDATPYRPVRTSGRYDLLA